MSLIRKAEAYMVRLGYFSLLYIVGVGLSVATLDIIFAKSAGGLQQNYFAVLINDWNKVFSLFIPCYVLPICTLVTFRKELPLTKRLTRFVVLGLTVLSVLFSLTVKLDKIIFVVLALALALVVDLLVSRYVWKELRVQCEGQLVSV